MEIDWANSTTPSKRFMFTLTLANIHNYVYQVVKDGWYYDIENEGQCQAYAVGGTFKTGFALNYYRVYTIIKILEIEKTKSFLYYIKENNLIIFSYAYSFLTRIICKFKSYLKN